MITIKRYSARLQNEWNAFVGASANGTFILDRRYMDYHKQKFVDHSLLIFQKNKLVAVFPANQKRTTIFSHEGLTYGGLIVQPLTSVATTVAAMTAITHYFHTKKFIDIIYKPVPTFFHTQPFHADIYALHILGATLTGMGVGFACQTPVFLPRRRRMVRKAKKNGVSVAKAPDCTQFWNQILEPHLAQKFHTKPVHSIGEIELLHKRFPTKIMQYNAIKNGNIVAGVTIYYDRGVAHTQYIASNNVGRSFGAVDYLFYYLMTQEFQSVRFFSFGTSQTESLMEWKEGFGAMAYPFSCYTLKTHE